MINLYKNDLWSEADIQAHSRAVIDSQVPRARQNELQTIMLGHLAGMRTASQDELAEIAQVQALTEQAALDNAQARADMALLAEVLAMEADPERQADPGSKEQTLYELRNPAPPEMVP